jgi:hypothetical protein
VVGKVPPPSIPAGPSGKFPDSADDALQYEDAVVVGHLVPSLTKQVAFAPGRLGGVYQGLRGLVGSCSVVGPGEDAA